MCPYLSVSVLDGGDVGVSEGAFDEAEDERWLPNTPSAKDHHPVVVALFRHSFQEKNETNIILSKFLIEIIQK